MLKLYLIYAREVGRVKIGLSTDPEKRLRHLQTGSPVQLELFAFRSHRNAAIKEGELHTRFQHKRVAGEWFELGPQDYVDLLKEWDFDPGLHYSKRMTEKIEVGDLAFISFDSSSLCKVDIVEYDKEKKLVSVRILEKIGHGVGRIGNIHGLFADEVWKDPVYALVNRVTM